MSCERKVNHGGGLERNQNTRGTYAVMAARARVSGVLQCMGKAMSLSAKSQKIFNQWLFLSKFGIYVSIKCILSVKMEAITAVL